MVSRQITFPPPSYMDMIRFPVKKRKCLNKLFLDIGADAT